MNKREEKQSKKQKKLTMSDSDKILMFKYLCKRTRHLSFYVYIC